MRRAAPTVLLRKALTTDLGEAALCRAQPRAGRRLFLRPLTGYRRDDCSTARDLHVHPRFLPRTWSFASGRGQGRLRCEDGLPCATGSLTRHHLRRRWRTRALQLAFPSHPRSRSGSSHHIHHSAIPGREAQGSPSRADARAVPLREGDAPAPVLPRSHLRLLVPLPTIPLSALSRLLRLSHPGQDSRPS